MWFNIEELLGVVFLCSSVVKRQLGQLRSYSELGNSQQGCQAEESTLFERRYQTTAGEDTAHWEDLVHAAPPLSMN
jgi:hypothetical protein